MGCVSASRMRGQESTPAAMADATPITKRKASRFCSTQWETSGSVSTSSRMIRSAMMTKSTAPHFYPVFPLFAPCDCRGHLQPGYARAERHLRHPAVEPVQGRNPLGLRFLRRFRLARTVEGDRLANERLEGGLVNLFSFVDVDRAACVSVETRVEETGRILQRRALEEGKLHDILVGFASADDGVVRPNRSAHPLPLLDDVRVCFLDELAHSAEGFPAPVPEFGDSFRDELRCRLALARARLFHVLILEDPDIFHLHLLERDSRSPRTEDFGANYCRGVLRLVFQPASYDLLCLKRARQDEG